MYNFVRFRWYHTVLAHCTRGPWVRVAHAPSDTTVLELLPRPDGRIPSRAHEDEWLLRDCITAHLRASQLRTLEAHTGEIGLSFLEAGSQVEVVFRLSRWAMASTVGSGRSIPSCASADSDRYIHPAIISSRRLQLRRVCSSRSPTSRMPLQRRVALS
jgi:hypothetical protein